MALCGRHPRAGFPLGPFSSPTMRFCSVGGRRRRAGAVRFRQCRKRREAWFQGRTQERACNGKRGRHGGSPPPGALCGPSFPLCAVRGGPVQEKAVLFSPFRAWSPHLSPYTLKSRRVWVYFCGLGRDRAGPVAAGESSSCGRSQTADEVIRRVGTLGSPRAGLFISPWNE
jgi:hypothetical protein